MNLTKLSIRCTKKGREFTFYCLLSRRRPETRYWRDWSSDVCSSDLRNQDQGLLTPSLAPFLVLHIAHASFITLEVMAWHAFQKQYSGAGPDTHLTFVNLSIQTLGNEDRKSVV